MVLNSFKYMTPRIATGQGRWYPNEDYKAQEGQT